MADVWLMVANPHPLWSLAWSQLPSPTFQSPLTPFPPLWPILYYNDNINNFGLLGPEQVPSSHQMLQTDNFLRLRYQQRRYPPHRHHNRCTVYTRRIQQICNLSYRDALPAYNPSITRENIFLTLDG
jgi:hypothetical protein